MKVISNTILFVYSLRGALIKITRVYHKQWYNYFDGTTPLLKKVKRHLVAFPGQYLTHGQSHITRPGPNGVLIRDHQNIKYQQVHSDKPIIMV